jgi:glycosyltransferase involved in cell wall biosynthesis
MATIGIIPNLNIKKNQIAIPMKTFEYMAGAIPVVASNHRYLIEFLGDNNAGLLANPGEPGRFAEHILYLTRNPGKAKAMGENGLRAFREKYCWENEAPRLIEYARGIASNK